LAITTTALNLARLSFQTAGLRAPWLMGRYARMAVLNRGFAQRRISRLPAALPASSGVAGPTWPPADIVIPIYNNLEDTRALLERVSATAASFGSVILINDCSPDERISPLVRDFAGKVSNAIVIENTRNIGFVRSCNRGFERSTGDVVILNTDIELPDGVVDRMLAALHSASDIATVTPFSNSAYGVGVPDLIHHNERPFGATTDEVDRAFQVLGALAPVDIPRGVGFCMAISRKMMDQIGPFSVDYGQGYGEEADFCMRARQAGFRSVIAPNAYVYHKAGQSFGGSWQQKARAGQMMLLDRHPHYVELMEEYFGRCEARAAGFIALVALARSLSGKELVVVSSEEAPAAGSPAGDIPVIAAEAENGEAVSLRLSYHGETYPFAFAQRQLAEAALRMAGIESPLI